MLSPSAKRKRVLRFAQDDNPFHTETNYELPWAAARPGTTKEERRAESVATRNSIRNAG